MTARAVLDRAKAAGLSLRTEGDALVCSPANKATEALLADIRTHKPGLMQLLGEPAVYPTSLEPGQRLKVGYAEIHLVADVDRYAVTDWSGRAVGYRQTLAEAIALAQAQSPEPPPRIRPKPPPMALAMPDHPREMRGAWPPPRPLRVVLRAPPRRRGR